MKYFFIIFFLFQLNLFADDSPDRDGGGKLDDMEKSDGYSGDNAFMVELLVNMIVYFPEIFIGSSNTYSFSEYPYQNDKGLFDENGTKKWHIDASAYFTQEANFVKGLNFDANLYPSKYVSFNIKHNRFSEQYNFHKNELNFTQTYIQYNRFRYERFNFQWGLGVINMKGKESHYSVAFNTGFTLYIHKPVSLDMDYSFGYLNDSFFTDFNTKFNIHSKRFKIFLGYKYLKAGNTPLNNIMIGMGYNL